MSTKSGSVRERRVIATIATGEQGHAMAAVSHPWMRRYAESTGADFFVLVGSSLSSLWPGFSKLALGNLLQTYDRLLYVDSDVLIAPGAPNLFELVPAGKVGATRIDQLKAEEAPAIANGWVARDISLVQQMFGSIGWQTEYFNSGVMVFSSAHRILFETALRLAEDWSASKERTFADQTLFNYTVKKEGIDLVDLGMRFNHTPAFNMRGHRYSSDFYHYVRLRRHRRGSRTRQMKVDSWVMRHPGLHGLLKRRPLFARFMDAF